MDKTQYENYRTLKNAGWNIQKHNQIRFNSGSETVPHLVAKSLVAKIGSDVGYRVSSEVTHNHRGSIDTLLWGHPDRLTLAVECETSPTKDTMNDKVERYVDGTPVDDLVLINVSNLPMDMLEAYERIMEVLNFG